MKPPVYLLAALMLAIAAPARAQEATPSQTPDASVLTPGGRSVTAFDRHARSGVGGYYDVELKQPLGGGPSSFDLHHLILEASGYVHEKLFFSSEIEFERGGVINGGADDGELKIEQAWADYTISDALGLRAGVVLIPFGIVNVLHDSDVRETTTRPLMAESVVPTTWFEPGIGVHGLIYPNDDWRLTYEAYLTQGLTDAISPATGLLAARPSLATDRNGNKALSGRVGLSPWLGLELGLDGYYGAYDPAGVKHLSMLGADMSYSLGPFELLGEYAHVSTEGGVASKGLPTAIPTGMGGLYVEGRYRFFPTFLQNTFLGAAGGFSHPAFTAVARWGLADTNQAAFDASDRTEAVLGLNYRPVQTFVTKLEYQRLTAPATGKVDGALWASVAVGF